jgi:di/tricarboxylate transporter
MAHPVNALVTAPGNYLFSDFARAGLPLLLLSFVLMLLGMRLFWGL